MSESAPLLRARGLAYGYGGRDKGREGRPVFAGVELEIRPGELVALIGENGAGKSTLLKVLSGLLPPSAGSVELGGAPLASLSRREIARRLALLPQSEPPAFAFTVREVVAMGRIPHRARLAPLDDSDRRAIEAALDAVDLRALAERPVTELSAGEHKRAELARALAQEAPLLLLDEPSSHLDLRHARELFAQVRARLDRGAGALCAIHDLSLAANVADRVLALTEGRARLFTSVEEAFAAPALRSIFGVRARLIGAPGARALAVEMHEEEE